MRTATAVLLALILLVCGWSITRSYGAGLDDVISKLIPITPEIMACKMKKGKLVQSKEDGEVVPCILARNPEDPKYTYAVILGKMTGEPYLVIRYVTAITEQRIVGGKQM